MHDRQSPITGLEIRGLISPIGFDLEDQAMVCTIARYTSGLPMTDRSESSDRGDGKDSTRKNSQLTT